jgi:hypothetical protein
MLKMYIPAEETETRYTKTTEIYSDTAPQRVNRAVLSSGQSALCPVTSDLRGPHSVLRFSWSFPSIFRMYFQTYSQCYSKGKEPQRLSSAYFLSTQYILSVCPNVDIDFRIDAQWHASMTWKRTSFSEIKRYTSDYVSRCNKIFSDLWPVTMSQTVSRRENFHSNLQ